MHDDTVNLLDARPDRPLITTSQPLNLSGKYAVPDGKGGHKVMLEGNFWPSIEGGCGNGGTGEPKGDSNVYDVPCEDYSRF